MVVSKAHTIGQGIRSVATEQIDRVYESLDPEYEYERERQKQQQPTQWSTQQWGQQQQQQQISQQQHPQPGQRQNDFTSQPQSTKSFNSSIPPQPKQDFRKDDISDLLQSHQPSPPLAHAATPVKKDGVSNNGLSQSKLMYNEDVAEPSTDAWGDDAWGDDWDDQADIDKVEPTTEPSPAVQKPTPLLQQQATPQPLNRTQEKSTFGFQSQHLDRQQDDPRPPSRGSQSSSESSRNVKDLFGSPRSGSSLSLGQGSRASNNLVVPMQHSGAQFPSDLPSHQRPSADLRPAEAIFSTLDFASNAIGSAVLGVHRKVTQAGQTQQQRAGNGLESQQGRSASPVWSTPQRRESGDSGKEVSEKVDRLALSNPTLEAVGGNVVSTGLGALEILGKRAVDVISDVRRAGHLSHGQGGTSGSEAYDEQNPFKVPPKMNIITMFEESGGKSHLAALRSLASAASTRVSTMASSRPDLLNVGQVDDLEQLLDPHSLDSAVKEPTADLLAGHKDFRAMVALLEQMGVQGTTHLRQLRNCTRKLATLVPDNVNAFEQEWHNHQTRASEKDFFARAPIKRFFESRLLTVYFDGLRALAQFTDKTCDQILRLAENFNIRVAEKTSNASSLSAEGDDDTTRLATLALAQVLQRLIGNLIAETKFIAKQYRLSLDAILQTAKGFTTPLDNLDWEDLAMGSDKIKTLLTDTEAIEAIGFIHSGALCVLEVLRNDLLIDVAFGRVTPTPRKPRSRPVVHADSRARAALISRPASKLAHPTSTPPAAAAAGAALNEPQAVGQSRPVMTTRPKTPVSQPSAVPSRGGPTSGGSPQSSNPNPHSYSLYPRPPPVPRPPVKEEEDFFSILNGV
ncbi:hypothetical protein BGX33_008783 [Mortierella sp. NVP41]|nr:hypothetical protein BGX33_008783 [Mortierella sp. NVP41]